MKTKAYSILLNSLAVILLALTPHGTRQKLPSLGENIILFEPRNFEEQDKQLLCELKNKNIGTISINNLFYQYSINSDSIDKKGIMPENYITLSSNTASKLGMKTFLRFLIDSRDKKPRTEIMPHEFNRWFYDYSLIALRTAELAKKNKNEFYSIGCELDSIISNNVDDFNNLIRGIKNSYDGKVTYCWNLTGINSLEKIAKIEQSLETDIISLDCYLPLKINENFTQDSLTWQWLYYLDKINQISRETGKKIIISEIGYRSIKDSNINPWHHSKIDSVDFEIQSICYNSFLEALKAYKSEKGKEDNIETILIWTVGDYSPWEKPAEKIILEYTKYAR